MKPIVEVTVEDGILSVDRQMLGAMVVVHDLERGEEPNHKVCWTDGDGDDCEACIPPYRKGYKGPRVSRAMLKELKAAGVKVTA